MGNVDDVEETFTLNGKWNLENHWSDQIVCYRKLMVLTVIV